MSRIKALRPNELIRILEKAGYTRARQTGSHVILTKAGKRSIPVPVHPKTLKRGLQETRKGYAVLETAGCSSVSLSM
jgi:predicted RNA binding protein YcfA (HicA-like mRNA interferase family)